MRRANNVHLDVHTELALLLGPGDVKRDNVLIDSDQYPAEHVDNAFPMSHGSNQILEEAWPGCRILKLEETRRRDEQIQPHHAYC